MDQNKVGEEAKIYLHFTNHKVSWGGKAPFKSTGFVENILENGLRKFANVGCGDVVEQLKNFVHHGCRTNKKRVHGTISIPAVIVIDGAGLQVQQGYDADNHLQINEAVSPDRILGWFDWDAVGIEESLSGKTDYSDELRDSSLHSTFREFVAEVIAGV